jgi:hypothetical protein
MEEDREEKGEGRREKDSLSFPSSLFSLLSSPS